MAGRSGVSSTWTNRITELTFEEPSSLTANPRNARIHPNDQREALRAVMADVGFIAPVIQNDRTGYLIDGHARVEEALSNGMPRIPVIHVDLDEHEEAEMLAVFDPIAELAKWDQERLDALIDVIDSDQAAIANLLNALASAADIVDTTPGEAPWDMTGDDPYAGVKSIVLVYGDAEYAEVIEWLNQQDGDTNAEKILNIARHVLAQPA